MPADYTEVLKDLDLQIEHYRAKLQTLQAARPTIVLLSKEFSPAVALAAAPIPPWVSQRYSSMGPTDAIPILLRDEPIALTSAQIAEKLKAGGIVSNAQNFVANVSATLSQLREKGIVTKVGDAWRLTTQEENADQEREERRGEAETVDYARAEIDRIQALNAYPSISEKRLS